MVIESVPEGNYYFSIIWLQLFTPGPTTLLGGGLRVNALLHAAHVNNKRKKIIKAVTRITYVPGRIFFLWIMYMISVLPVE